MYIDTHAHLNFNAFKDDADEVIRRTLTDNVWMILVGAEQKTSRRAVDIANRYEKGVFAAVGLHPSHVFNMEIKENDHSYISQDEIYSNDVYEKMASFQKVVAIGEVGLDYYRIETIAEKDRIKELQKEVFIKQLELSARIKKPIIIHCRNAHDDMLDILKEFKKEYRNFYKNDRLLGVMHCFSGGQDLAWEYFSLGLMISFTGIITFSRQWDDVIKKVPSDRIMIETDCPYLTPEPYRGARNEPVYVKYVANRIAEIKNLDVARIEEITEKNAKRLFGI